MDLPLWQHYESGKTQERFYAQCGHKKSGSFSHFILHFTLGSMAVIDELVATTYYVRNLVK